MAHVNIEKFRGTVQLSRKTLSINCRTGIRQALFTTRPKAGARSIVSCSNIGLLLAVLLVLLCILHFAQGSSARCTEIPRVAAEHTFQAGGWKLSCHQVDPAPEVYHSCKSGELKSCWSCLDLDASKPNRQPFFLQSASSYERSQASLGRDVVSSKFSLGEFGEGLSLQFRKGNLGPIDVNSKEDWQIYVDPGDVEAMHWRLVDVVTECIGNPGLLSVSSSRSFFTVKLDQQLEAASWSWRCRSTLSADLGARITKQSEAAAEAAGAFPTTDSTKSGTLSSNLGTEMLSFHKTMQMRTWTDSLLLQILEAIDDELHADHDSCNNHGKRTMRLGRRMLISDSWKPVIVVDSVVVGIGFFLAVSALSCWVWQWRAVIKSDGSHHRPSILPSSAVAPAVDSPSPRRRPGESGRARRSRSADSGEGPLSPLAPQGSGRWAQARDGPGRWEEIPEEEEEAFRGGQGATEDDPGKDSRAEEGGQGRGPQVPEEGQPRGLQSAEEEGPGRRSPMTGQESDAEDKRTGATVHSSSPSRYRAEPFCFQGLKAITGGFHEQNKLGSGSFGSVYRGLLFDGREVAIKRADRNNVEKLVNKQNSFKAELDVMSRLHHKHLVNLVGYCDDCGEMMLVYEYMPNGTLSDHLHNKRFQSRALFSWKVRIRVALQAARGIEYLHTYAEPPVIHRDIKSSNILLDAKGSVRVSDFGLCLIFPSSSDEEEEEEGRQHVTTNAAGTIGYMDPEYYCHRHLTTKSDVYSFGVVILELLTGKWAIHRRNNSEVTVVDYAVPAIESDDIASILDPRVQVVSRNEFAAIKVMAEVGRQAVRRRGKDRPSMTEIIRRLEDAVTLCRSRHAPIPVFGADIGSSDTDPSLSPPSRSRPSSGPSPGRLGPLLFRSDPGRAAAAAPPFDKSVKGVVQKADDRGPASGTDVAQVGSVLQTSSQVRILEEFVQDIHPGGSRDRVDGPFDDHYYPSDVVNIQFYNDFPWPPDSHKELLCPARSSGSDASVSNKAVVSSASAISGLQADVRPLSRSHSSSRWESEPDREPLLQKLRQSWQRSAPGRSMIKSGEFVRSESVFSDGALPRRGGGSFYSCEGERGSAAAEPLLATEVPLDFYSAVVVDDPLLDRRTPVMAGFSNFSEQGPPEDVIPSRPPPQQFPPEQREIGSHERRVGHGEEPSYGLGLAAGQVWKGTEGCDSSADDDDIGGDVDIHDFASDEYPDEQAGSTSYAGFSNFSVLQDLDELMKALHTLDSQQEPEQEVLEEF